MKNRKFIFFIIIFTCIVILWANMNSMYKLQSKDDFSSLADKDIPATLPLATIALGPIRGLIVDALWWRAIQLQDSGEFFEAIQLADWITALQPKFASIWAFQGWNLAYNISYEFRQPKEKWKWIEAGLTLMRNRGLKYNPNSTVIKGEIASIFYDKIGGYSDPNQEYFKDQWSKKMLIFLKKGTKDELIELLKAPFTEQKLKQNKKIKAFFENLKISSFDITDIDKNLNNIKQLDFLLKKTDKKTRMKIITFLRAKHIREELKMSIKKMIEIDELYGPFDWRTHQAHAVYWTVEENKQKDNEETTLSYTPMIRQSMIESFRTGKLIYDSKNDFMIRTNNLAIFGKIHDYFETLLLKNKTANIDSAHKSFLEEGAVILYTFNHIDESKELYKHYAEDYAKGKNYISFDNFILRNMDKVMRGQAFRNKKSLITSALYQGFVWYAIGDYDRAIGYEKLAKMVWNHNQKISKNNKGFLLPSFEKLKLDAYNLAKGKYSSIPKKLIKKLKNANKNKNSVKTEKTKVNTGKVYHNQK